MSCKPEELRDYAIPPSILSLVLISDVRHSAITNEEDVMEVDDAMFAISCLS